MKILVVLLVAVCCVQCRKTYQPLDKNANLDFINMEGGGGARPGPAKPASAPAKPASAPAKPVAGPVPKPAAPAPATPKPVAVPVTPKPVVVITPPTPTPAKPAQSPSQIKPVPVNPKPVANPISTPGPGTVKQLVNFYDSQGKASPIRPYSYSQAVKQG